jgi:hypothetical protein
MLDALPKTLDEYAAVSRDKPKPKFWTAEECQTLVAKASQRTKLYILLGLNAGYTQIDISSLRHDMID